MSWRYFVGAVILAGGLMLKFGAPAEAVAMGTLLAALVNWKGGRWVPGSR